MQIDTLQGAISIVKPDGPVTGADAEQFENHLLTAFKDTVGRFVLDASDIAFVDSRGLEVLCEVTREMAKIGLVLKLCAVNETVRELLELTELAPLFEYFKDVNGAARSLL